MKNPEAFEGKTFQDILKDIYDNSVQKKASIQSLRKTLSGLITTAQEAALIAPLVKDLIDVEVKNDEHLVKIATIMQRVITADSGKSGKGMDSLLSDQEKEDLLAELDSALTDEAYSEVEEKANQLLEVEDEAKNS